jgi:hypothetical protein
MNNYFYIILYIIAGCLFTLFFWRRETLFGQLFSILFFPLLILHLLFQVLVLYIGDTYLSLLTSIRNQKRDAAIAALITVYVMSIFKGHKLTQEKKDEDGNRQE